MSLKLKKNERPSRITIDKRIFIRTREETEAAYNQKIAEEIQKFSFYDRCDLLFDFAKEQKLPKQFVPVYGKDIRFHGVYSLAKRFLEIIILTGFLVSFTGIAEYLKAF